MIFWESLKQKISQAAGLDTANFSYPSQADWGDLSLACFELAKTSAKTPVAAALELEKKLNLNQELKKYFFAIKAAGPYLNFFISPEYLASAVIKTVRTEKKNYGANQIGTNKKIMIEYSNGNTHKEYHVGHLRNLSYGDAVNRLLNVNGYRAIPVSYINDFGIHVAKTIWYLKKKPEYRDSLEDKGYLLGRCYAEASKILLAQPEDKTEVVGIMKEIESRHGDNYKLWQETRQWSIKYFAAIYQELGVSFKNIFYENEMIEVGLRLVAELIEKGILIKSEGAIVADLEKYNLGVLPIIRSDGTALYPVADLALAGEKFKKYDLSESIYVVDVRQSLYFKQLFKILELYGDTRKRAQLAYEFVTLPDGMMSSRTGNVITYEELKNKIEEKLILETKKRHPDWTLSRVSHVASDLTVSTIKFEMLKVSADKAITFNINEALKFDGYTACYLQYGYARLKSIIRKNNFDWFYQTSPRELKEPGEKKLLLKIAKYPEIIKLAGEKYNPSEVTKYLFELVQLANDYYHEVNILKAAPKVKKARLMLVKAVAQVLKNGFAVLGLKTLEEM
ncbi:MAG: arginine--tRNA ligase [Patescibacteria group bacterium]